MYLTVMGQYKWTPIQKEKIIQVYSEKQYEKVHCEVDVYGKVDGSLWLGHDGPSIKQMISF